MDNFRIELRENGPLEMDTIYWLLKKNDWQDIVFNNELILHIVHKEDGSYCLDLYKKSEYDKENNDYGFITGTFVTRKDLIDEN